MKRFICIAILYGATTITVQANETTDPALLVCEEVLKSKLKAPKSYERHKYAISGLKVFIAYDAVNTYNAPIRSTKTCHFVLNENKKYVLKSEIIQKNDLRMDQILEEIKASKSNKQIEMLLAESRKLTSETIDAAMSDFSEELAAADTGLYPIEPENTQLSPR